jgi:hypothetical protein
MTKGATKATSSAAPTSSTSSDSGSNKRKVDDAAKEFLGNIFGNQKAVKVEKSDSPWSPKKKSKITECIVYLVYAYLGEDKLLVGIFILNCYDRCGWLKGEVDYLGEMTSLVGLELLYAATRMSRFRRSIPDFTDEVPKFEGTDCPLLLRTQAPLWFKCALEDTVEATVVSSAQLEAFVQQLEQILPGSPDLSNHATFSLTKTVIEYPKDDIDKTQKLCATLVALKPVNRAT